MNSDKKNNRLELNSHFRAAYPQLGGHDLRFFRVGGPGLGNLLFPWARAVVWAHENDAFFLAPTWPQFKLGPFLRRESDLRGYAFQFVDRAEDIGGWRRQLALTVSRQLDESGETIRNGLPNAGEVRRFSGLSGYFEPFIRNQALVRKALLEIVRPELTPEPQVNDFVAVHVRCGDFRSLPLEAKNQITETGLPNQYRLPVSFFVDALHDVRSVIGADIEVRVYSDGTDEELRPLLRLPRVQRSVGSNAVTDLLEMSCARCVIGTPHSTFSMWAAFLGNVPLVGFPEAGNRSYGVAPITRQLDSQKRRQELGAAFALPRQ